MCSHVASIIWYLGIGRHQPERKLYKWAKFFGDAPTVSKGTQDPLSDSEDTETDHITPTPTLSVYDAYDIIVEVEEVGIQVPMPKKRPRLDPS
jgi:hypothetical protein